MIHPILNRRGRLAPYLAAWLLFGGLLTLVLGGTDPNRWITAAGLAVPLCLIYGFISLSSWYPCQANPLGGVPLSRLLAVHLSAGLISSGVWVLIGTAWAQFLTYISDRSGQFGLPLPNAAALFRVHLPLFFAVGVLLYVLAASTHYLFQAFEASRNAERRAMGLQLLAREAEIEAFRNQIDPHFLFNCLNSISSLCGSDPQGARRMAVRLGEFLRNSLKLAARESITLAEELELLDAFVEVERARWGDRLRVEQNIDADLKSVPIPALVLQPLMENTLKHGIAHLLDGGTVRIEATRQDSFLCLAIQNPCDPERPQNPAPDRRGIGLDNVRGRLRLLYNNAAALSVDERPESFRVEIRVPISGPAGSIGTN